jgi:1-acyl-sn-glycerol-3-phosphate acyltransferase
MNNNTDNNIDDKTSDKISENTSNTPMSTPSSKPLVVPAAKWPIWPAIYPLVIFVTGLYLRVLGLEIRGSEHVPATGGVLIACNHLTNLDAFVVAQGMGKRWLYTMGKRELFETDFGNWFYRSGRIFPVDRARADLGAIRTGIKLLQQGEALLIFPQGTRGGQSAQAGVGMLALKAKVPILPVAIERVGLGHRLTFGPLIAAEGKMGPLTEQVMAAIDKMLGV